MGVFKQVRNVEHIQALRDFHESWDFHQARAYFFYVEKEKKKKKSFSTLMNFSPDQQKFCSASLWLQFFSLYFGAGVTHKSPSWPNSSKYDESFCQGHLVPTHFLQALSKCLRRAVREKSSFLLNTRKSTSRVGVVHIPIK